MIGKYISALANSSALLNRQFSYVIWGIEDSTKEIIGTKFYPYTEKINQGEPLISWLERLLDPRIDIQFKEYNVNDKHIVILIVDMNVGRPVSFNGTEYIRSGSSIKTLSQYPEKERRLWKSFDSRAFEKEFALTNCSISDIFKFLDTDTYIKLLNYPMSLTDDEMIEHMISDELIERSGNNFNITNMGAFTFAKRLDDFEHLNSRAVRIIKYKGNNKVQAIEDITASKGIAVGFRGLLQYLQRLLPQNPEELQQTGQIISETDYPLLVIREIVANQIVHQDFSFKGSSSMIEIFDNRVIFTNPGAPLNEPERLLDLPPYSRNERLANLFRKMKLVESRGSGIDKVIITLESKNLPAPDIRAEKDFTMITLFKRKNLQDMTTQEKINAIYYHSAILFIEGEYMTNKSVRERFGLSQKQSSIASKIISLALDHKKIKPYDSDAGKKNMQYIPYWASDYN